jgi:hypothetical protein
VLRPLGHEAAVLITKRNALFQLASTNDDSFVTFVNSDKSATKTRCLLLHVPSRLTSFSCPFYIKLQMHAAKKMQEAKWQNIAITSAYLTYTDKVLATR